MTDLNELLRQVDSLRQDMLRLHEQMQAIPGPDKYVLSAQIPKLLKAATAIDWAAQDAPRRSLVTLNSLWSSTSDALITLDLCLTDGQHLYKLEPDTRAYVEAMQRIRRRLPDGVSQLDRTAAILRKLGATVAVMETAEA